MKKYLLIGGEFENKGAEAMTFATIQAIREQEPSAEIYMLLDAKHMETSMLEACGVVGILDQPSRRMYCAGGLERLSTQIRKKNTGEDFYKLNDLLKSIDKIVDISGYAFTSAWGIIPTISSCSILKAAHKNNSEYYIMPQSFGPFDYKWYFQPFIMRMIRKSLSYAKVIYAREQEGYDFLKNKFKLTNVKRSYDMILQCKEYNENFIFIKDIEHDIIDISSKKNAAIIPNVRNNKYVSEVAILDTYRELIRILLSESYNVYIFAHSREDLEECKKIKKLYGDDERVVIIDKDLSCIDYERNIKNFDLCVASRYHSIVHAYKQSVPCIGLGWATKYTELLELFEQEKYWIDVRKIEKINAAYMCSQLIENVKDESKKIELVLEKIQKTNCLREII